MQMNSFKEVKGTPFEYYEALENRLLDLDHRLQEMRQVGKLNPQILRRIHNFFKIKGIYHSNAIEGNALTITETQMVVEMGMTLSGKTLRDQAEAKNLSHAMEFMEAIAVSTEKPITLSDMRQIHALVLKDIQDEHAGRYRIGEVKVSGSDYLPTTANRIPQQMSELGDFVRKVTAPEPMYNDFPVVCAAAAHAWLAQIHPFVDGNGRTARILMNLILMRRGYPICIITCEDRLRYYEALENSQSSDLTSLIDLMVENFEESLEEWENRA